MSAREALAVPKTDLPDLPPELWSHILRFATAAPEFLFDPEQLVWADLPLQSVPHQLKYLRKSMKIKRNVVQVSKAWNALAAPYLYESIVIRRDHQLPSLCSSLAKSRRQSELVGDGQPCSPCYGASTFRLDIHVHNHVEADIIQDELLIELIRSLPNLAIITFFYRERDCLPQSLLDALGDACDSSLQLLNYSCQWPGPCRELYSLTAKAYNIRAASLPMMRMSSGSGGREFLGLPISAHITTLDFIAVDLGRYIRNDDVPVIPSLRRVRLMAYDGSLAHLHPFFRANGSGVVSMMVHSYLQSHDELSQLGEMCPNLVTLFVGFCCWHHFNPDLILPSTIVTFGVFCEQLQAQTKVYEYLFTALATMQTQSLKVVRILDPRHVKDFRERHGKVFSRTAEMIRGRGWRLEDSEGGELV